MVYILLLTFEIVVLYFVSRRINKSVFRFFYRITKRKNWSMYLYATLFLPGTFIHEMSHFLVALVLLVPVGKLELVPRVEEEEKGYELGSVAIAKTDPVRRFLIGFAPLIFGLLIIFTILYFVSVNRFIDTWWGNILAAILIFEVGNSMFASKKDLEGTLVLFIFILFIIAFLYLLGVETPINLEEVIYSESFQHVLKLANIFLLIPIMIDASLLHAIKERRF